ncbi:hypothetical protein DFJ77DRAFT_435451 [Powellomyces hirtus]|nr:hypothetical protein DFJ77DRAFT_435451 [Powellomyces hirtus]
MAHTPPRLLPPPPPPLSGHLGYSIAGDSMMHRMVMDHPWHETSLGPIHDWPESLLSATALVLNAGFPMVLFWGQDCTMIYNDGYIPMLGAKHPTALGLPGQEAWSEVWEEIGPMMDSVFRGKATFSDDQLLLLTRYGYVEECYFTWSYSPVPKGDGTVAGVITPIQESTPRLLSQRRLRTLHSLSMKMGKVTSVSAALQVAAKIFETEYADVPVSALYLYDPGSRKLTLEGSSGLSDPHPSMPAQLSIDDPMCDALWPFTAALDSFQMLEVPVGEIWDDASGGIWVGQRPDKAVVFSIRQSEMDQALGIMVMGVNPRKQIDEPYREFCELLRKQLVTGILSARAYEEELSRAEALAALDQAKTTFFSNISHEFRTPLTLIVGPLTDLLTRKDLPPEVVQQLQVMNRATLRLLKLVNTILDFSRLESGRSTAQYRPTNLASLTADLGSMFRSAMEAGGLTYTVDIEDEKTIGDVWVDAEMWEKIVSNLLSNAYKFTLEGEIVLTLRRVPVVDDSSGQRRDDDVIRLAVRDTGCGIPEQSVNKVFERFYRVEGSSGRSHEGSGIGLALTMELAKMHGGKCYAESAVGVGTTITVEIPAGTSHMPRNTLHQERRVTDHASTSRRIAGFLAEASKWAENGKNVVKAASRCSPKHEKNDHPRTFSQTAMGVNRLEPYHILLADDNPDLRDYIARILEDQFTVSVVVDGQEALEAAIARSPDLILSDVMMPRLNGFELVHKIRSIDALKLTPVILLSARAGEEAHVEGLDHGADDYLVKPFSRKELLARVQTHLELGQLRKKLTKDLHMRESQFQMVCSFAPVGIAIGDEHGRPLYANQHWLNLAGFAADSDPATWASWADHIHPADREGILATFNAANGPQKVPFSTEFRWMRADGTARDIMGHSTPLCVPGQPPEWFTATLDVTEQKQAARERMQMKLKEIEAERKRANEADERRRHQESFIDMICHEMRNPLNGIINNADLLRTSAEARASRKSLCNSQTATDDKDDAEAVQEQVDQDLEAINAIQMCARHQQVIVDDVLNLSKLGAKRIILNPTWCDPAQVLARVVTMFSAEGEKKGIRLETALKSSDLPPADEVFIDSDRLSQIAFNLLTNAMKFTEKSTVKDIRIGLELEGEGCVNPGTLTPPDAPPFNTSTGAVPSGLGQHEVTLTLTVRDTGIGMTPEEQTTLYKRFSQANGKTEYGGSGLGLFICKELVEYMNGTISVTSTKGHGAEFRVQFSCERRRPPAPPPASRRGSLAATRRRSHGSIPASIATGGLLPSDLRVLIVEDNIVNQRVLSRQLELVGFKFSVANNGLEAVQLTTVEKFDVVIMDIEMPVMDGLQATTRIRELERVRQGAAAGSTHGSSTTMLQAQKELAPAASYTPATTTTTTCSPSFSSSSSPTAAAARPTPPTATPALTPSPQLPILGLSGNARDESRLRAMQAGMNDYMVKPYDRKCLFAKIIEMASEAALLVASPPAAAAAAAADNDAQEDAADGCHMNGVT